MVTDSMMLLVFGLKVDPPELKMLFDIRKQYSMKIKEFKDIPKAVRWSALDPSSILAFSRSDVIITVRNKNNFTRKWITFNDIADAEFVPFSKKYIAILTKGENELCVINWQSVKHSVLPEDIKGRYKCGTAYNKMYFCGSNNNKNKVDCNLLLISKHFGVLVKMSLGKKVEFEEPSKFSIIAESTRNDPLFYFDIHYGLLFVLLTDTDLLSVYKYNHNGSSIMDLLCNQRLKLNGVPTKFNVVVENADVDSIKLFMIDSEGVKSYCFTTNKIAPCVEKRESGSEGDSVRNAESQEIVQDSLEQQADLLGSPAYQHPTSEEIKKPIASSSPKELGEAVDLKGSVMPKSAKTKEVGTDPQLEPDLRNNSEALKQVLKKDVAELVKEEVKNTIIPLMENSFKKILADMDKETNSAIVKFSKEYELQSVKMDSMCLLYEMNMESIMKQHTKYTEMVKSLIRSKSQSSYNTEAAERQEYIPQAIMYNNIPEIPHIPEGPVAMSESYISQNAAYGNSLHVPYEQVRSVGPFEVLPVIPEHIQVPHLLDL
eukprot:TRINITY_DN4822_c0_g8_i2.p1 TRINITY_DN4822_c0_g8~~TRINITY_DN4822_c0_g8_i2.p1  ORF type:complete len:544 (-),score=110.43 TRINITY_DN4822_c0_g8_i2:409-2040(-)